ncbi:MAG TPA: OsmC family peroxiredoxin [Chloroflexota bacterium]|jgi:osmotically inducible protein OsmC|nr:OsmC family peroxiredoxin [Chloroflexota bacterium]
MPLAERRAEAVWEGNLVKGNGRVKPATGAFAEVPVTWASRVERPDGKTSPEELIAMAHASCYAMALSHTLAEAGSPPERLHVTATCQLESIPGGIKIATMNLEVRGRVPGIDQATFEEMARKGERGCPVSNALRNNVQINVRPTLER